MKQRKNNLDERQEKELLLIEHKGMWLAFWALCAAIIIQSVMGAPRREIAGEWIVFMALCVYTLIACIRKGIWDRYLKPTFAINLICSIIAGLVVAGFTMIMMWRNGGMEFFPVMLLLSIGMGVITCLLCVTLLTICARATKRRQEKLDAGSEEDEE